MVDKLGYVNLVVLDKQEWGADTCEFQLAHIGLM